MTLRTARLIGGRLPAAAAAVVVVVGAVAVALLLSAGWWQLVPVVGLIAVVAWLYSSGEVRSTLWVAAVCLACVGAVSAVSFGVVWPIPQAVGLCVATAVLRRQGLAWPAWLGSHAPDRPALLLAVASVPFTTAALVAFIASGRTDLETATEGLQSLPLWVVPLAGLGFVLANPLVEEVLFRGVLQTMITERSGHPTVGIVIQGLAFGAIHLGGVPGGPLGVVMAGSWGIVLGVIRYRTDSIRLAWVVHVLANIAIFSTVVGLAIRDGVL